MLSGGESPAALRKAAEVVEETLPDSRNRRHGWARARGLGDTGTELFTAEVLSFV